MRWLDGHLQEPKRDRVLRAFAELGPSTVAPAASEVIMSRSLCSIPDNRCAAALCLGAAIRHQRAFKLLKTLNDNKVSTGGAGPKRKNFSLILICLIDLARDLD